MPLKYQAEIDVFELKNCPANVKAPESAVEVCRFSFNPIEHELNFLPNVIFDKKINSPYNYENKSEEEKCLRCGSSFYVSIEKALTGWNNLPERIKTNLGYTHIAQGKLNAKDGFMNEPAKNGHFTFYENDGANLRLTFMLIKQL